MRFKLIPVALFTLLSFVPILSLQGQTTSSSKKRHITPIEFKEELKGPILSFPTTFTKDLEVDYKGTKNLIERALGYGCKVVALTSGNNMYDRLSFNEIKKLTRLMVTTVGDRGITIAATGNWSEDTVINYVRYAESVGASAVQVNPPENANEDIEKTVKFYWNVANSTNLGIVLHGNYSVDLLKQLVKIKSIVALKEDVPNLHYYIDRQVMFGDRIAIFSGGDDARYLFGYPYGSPAYFSILYTYAPKIGQKFWKAIQTKNMKETVKIVTKYDLPFMKLWSRPFWNAAISYLGRDIIQPYIRSKKSAMQEQESLSEKELKVMREDLRKIGLQPSTSGYHSSVIRGPSLPVKWRRGGHIGGKVNDKIVIAGGTQWSKDKTTKSWLDNSIIFYKGKWVQGPELPKPIAYAMFSYNKSGLYVAGGTSNGKSVSNKVYKLVSLKQGWETLPPLPEKLDYGSGAILNDKFYIACGYNGSEMSNKVWVLDLYNPENGWKQCMSVPGVERVLPSLVTCGKYLYLLGGLAKWSPLTPLEDAYRYDPAKDQWKKLRDLPLKGYAWVSQPVDSSHLIITGRAYGKIDNGIWIIDLRDMSMHKIGNDVVPAATAPLVNVGDKQWWLIGGEPDSNKNRTEVISVIKVAKRCHLAN